LISNVRPVLKVVLFLLGDFPTSEFYMPTFGNTLFYLHRRCKHSSWLHRLWRWNSVFRNAGS